MINTTLNTAARNVADLFPPTVVTTHKRQNQRILKRKLGEVILGQRPFLNVYSDALQTDIWFVNEGMVNPSDPLFVNRVITMNRLAEIIGSNDTILKTVEKLFGENQQ
ncbi:MAG: hypothetical protein E4H13_03705 [Calditrichales bacterium]|nr:MAG: hypothetical protein E4H13_03705 [Calditrichales bacterium]